MLGEQFGPSGQGELLAWSRLHEGRSVLVALNTHGIDARGADVTVDATIHPPGSALTVLYRGDWNPEQLKNPPADQTVTVQQEPDGRAWIHLDLPADGMMILA